MELSYSIHMFVPFFCQKLTLLQNFTLITFFLNFNYFCFVLYLYLHNNSWLKPPKKIRLTLVSLTENILVVDIYITLYIAILKYMHICSWHFCCTAEIQDQSDFFYNIDIYIFKLLYYYSISFSQFQEGKNIIPRIYIQSYYLHCGWYL